MNTHFCTPKTEAQLKISEGLRKAWKRRKDKMTWIQTFSGKQFNFRKISPNAIDIQDIAHSLSLIPRFGGHCLKHYSVAEHSVRVSAICNDQLAGLLHDAAEAYIGDVVRPLKKELGSYIGQIEEEILSAVAAKFDIDPSRFFSEEVKRCDNILLQTERRDVMMPTSWEWTGLADVEPLEKKINPLTASNARLMFLSRFSKLLKDEQCRVAAVKS